jgi:hypothetical protein
MATIPHIYILAINFINPRYFSIGYDARNHACVLRHANGIAVICLAPSHPVLERKLKIVSIDFDVGASGSDISNTVWQFNFILYFFLSFFP